MKVSTDACIQGARAAAWPLPEPARILDIGTGTGLLSLMLVQRYPGSHIDAVELNPDAFMQAERNFRISPWHTNLHANQGSLQDYARRDSPDRYGFIICNPPFFHNHLQAQQQARNDARHSIALSKEELAETVSFLLREQGVFCVMYPQTEW